ncbi:MAG: hypothetical protein WBA74_12695, partial [Cyclobacteriaceae bacterium]
AQGIQDVNILTTVLPPTNAIVDSVKMNLRFSGYFTDPSAKSHKIEVLQVVDTLFSNAIYTADEEVSYVRDRSDQVIHVGSYEYEINPATDSVLTFDMEQFYGISLFSKLELIREDISALRSFGPGELNPLAFVSSDDNEALVAFDPTSQSSNIVVHYHTPTDSLLTYSFHFRNTSGNSLSHFNQIKVDRTGAKFGGLTDEKFQTVDLDEEVIYMNPATGVLPLVSLEEVHEFFNDINEDEGITLNVISSQLVMPVNPSDTGIYESNSSTLRYYFADENGKFNPGNVVLDPGRNIVLNDDGYLSINGGNVNTGIINNNLFSIIGNMTLFTQFMIDDRINPDAESELFPSHFVMIPALNSSFNQTTFFKDGIKMRVYYTIVK